VSEEMNTVEFGYYGNIWIRQNTLNEIGDQNDGHYHKYDHVTLVTSGKIQVEIDGYNPTEHAAPTFVIIRKDYMHKVTALEPNTVYYCLYALRDLDGEVLPDIHGGEHDPMSAGFVLVPGKNDKVLAEKAYRDNNR
jgi:hypothetical protein